MLPESRIALIDARAARSRDEVLRRLIALQDKLGDDAASPEELLDLVREREALASTGIGLNLAIPHGRAARIPDWSLSLGLLSEPGVDFGAQDGSPVRIAILVLGPEDRQEEYLRLLARLTRFLKDEREALLVCVDAAAVAQIVARS